MVIATEAAGWSTGTETSQEAEPIEQLKARQLSFDREDKPLLIVEGTSTIKEELPWSAYSFTSKSRILSPCVHCGCWVSPEREHLSGWEEARNAEEARSLTFWACPNCGEAINDDQRRDMVLKCKLVHEGQSIDKKGNIQGELPPTRKLWFRWSAWHNMNVSTATLGEDEWETHQHDMDSEKRESAEKKMCQFRFAIPYEPLNNEVLKLTEDDVLSRKAKLPLGIIPEDCTHLAVGIDVGVHRCYFSLLCGLPGGRLYIPRYDHFEVPSKQMDFVLALKRSFREFWESIIIPGFPWDGHAERFHVNQAFIDAGDGDATDTVFEICRGITGGAFKGKILPIFGRGTAQMQKIYVAPVNRNRKALEIGDGWHVGMVQKGKTKQRRGWGGFINVDLWKERVQRSLTLEEMAPGSITLYAVPGDGHRKFAKHITNEHKEIEKRPNRGEVQVWKRTGQQAWLDTTVYARVALERAGWSLEKVAEDPE